MRYGTDPIKAHDRSNLRLLGTVGEAINPDAWRWYYEEVGESRCSILDTYWQTESGGVLLTQFPGCTPMKVGSCGFPFFGVVPAILDPITGLEFHRTEAQGLLAIKSPWPGMAKSIFGNHRLFHEAYFSKYPGVVTPYPF